MYHDEPPPSNKQWALPIGRAYSVDTQGQQSMDSVYVYSNGDVRPPHTRTITLHRLWDELLRVISPAVIMQHPALAGRAASLDHVPTPLTSDELTKAVLASPQAIETYLRCGGHEIPNKVLAQALIEHGDVVRSVACAWSLGFRSHNRWCELEQQLLAGYGIYDADLLASYQTNVIRGPWPEWADSEWFAEDS